MAFEKVYIRNNTSVIVDEVLAHRIGLLPIEVDSRVFNFQNPGDKPNDKVVEISFSFFLFFFFFFFSFFLLFCMLSCFFLTRDFQKKK